MWYTDKIDKWYFDCPKGLLASKVFLLGQLTVDLKLHFTIVNSKFWHFWQFNWQTEKIYDHVSVSPHKKSFYTKMSITLTFWKWTKNRTTKISNPIRVDASNYNLNSWLLCTSFLRNLILKNFFKQLSLTVITLPHSLYSAHTIQFYWEKLILKQKHFDFTYINMKLFILYNKSSIATEQISIY